MESEDEIRYKLLANISKLLVMQVRMGNEQIRQLEKKLEEAGADENDSSIIVKDCRILVRSIVDQAHRTGI